MAAAALKAAAGRAAWRVPDNNCMVEADLGLESLSISSKFNTDGHSLERLVTARPMATEWALDTANRTDFVPA